MSGKNLIWSESKIKITTPVESGSISSNKSSMDIYSWKSTAGKPFQSQIGDIAGGFYKW